MDLAGRAGWAFYVEEQGVPAYGELILVTRTGLVGDARPPKFLDALALATLYRADHSRESWGLFVRGRPELGDEPNRRAWRDAPPRFAAFPDELGPIPKNLPVDTHAIELR